MSGTSETDFTSMLHAAAEGDAKSSEKLIVAVYAQLRAVAAKLMAGERAGHTIGATALVHEAYLRLALPRRLPWKNRKHYYIAAVEAMRRVLIDHARAKGRQKRGGDSGQPISLDDVAAVGADFTSAENLIDFIALDQAIARLEKQDPRMVEVVRLRYFAGLEIDEVARVLEISERTVKNDWAFAKAWLQKELSK